MMVSRLRLVLCISRLPSRVGMQTVQSGVIHGVRCVCWTISWGEIEKCEARGSGGKRHTLMLLPSYHPFLLHTHTHTNHLHSDWLCSWQTHFPEVLEVPGGVGGQWGGYSECQSVTVKAPLTYCVVVTQDSNQDVNKILYTRVWQHG